MTLKGVEPFFEGRCQVDAEAKLTLVGIREDGRAVGENLCIGEGKVRDFVESWLGYLSVKEEKMPPLGESLMGPPVKRRARRESIREIGTAGFDSQL